MSVPSFIPGATARSVAVSLLDCELAELFARYHVRLPVTAADLIFVLEQRGLRIAGSCRTCVKLIGCEIGHGNKMLERGDGCTRWEARP